jgi:hypothetical protein
MPPITRKRYQKAPLGATTPFQGCPEQRRSLGPRASERLDLGPWNRRQTGTCARSSACGAAGQTHHSAKAVQSAAADAMNFGSKPAYTPGLHQLSPLPAATATTSPKHFAARPSISDEDSSRECEAVLLVRGKLSRPYLAGNRRDERTVPEKTLRTAVESQLLAVRVDERGEERDGKVNAGRSTIGKKPPEALVFARRLRSIPTALRPDWPAEIGQFRYFYL